MPTPIRLLHFADLHIGMENYGKLDPATGVSSRIGDFLARLDEIVQYALDHDADLVIFAGDAFKTRDPDPTQQREFARRIKKLADRLPVFLLVGNHDIPGIAARATSVDIFRALEVPNIIVGRTSAGQVIQTKRGPVFLGWMPFPVRNRLITQEELRGASVEGLDRALEGKVIDLLQSLADEAKDQAMPRVLTGHFSVGGATFGSERSVMLGRDLVVPRSALADPAWDYVALGHIHKHQVLTSRPPLPLHEAGRGEAEEQADARLPAMVYPGSLERIDFGEEADPKGFCWVELARGATSWRFVPVDARPFRTITADVRQAADPTAEVVAAVQARDLNAAIVRLQIRLREGQEGVLRQREIEAALAGANLAIINKEVEYETRLAGVSANPESLTPLQWTERYFAAKNKTPEQVEKLLRAAEELVTDE
jgi:exonuclease SbcD